MTKNIVYNHLLMIGILLTNLGTPDAPTPSAIRRYLREFLSDPRVVEIPRILWLPILYGFILPFRPFQTAKRYQAIWTAEGSPLLTISRQQQQALQKLLPVKVELGMRYGSPSIQIHPEITKLLVLPLYPQYCAATTASSFDAVSQALKKRRIIPEIRMINSYFDEPSYIQALAQSIQKHRQSQKLLFSFHGIPKNRNDLYAEQCHTTARLVAEAANLKNTEWEVVFQSRFGRAEWLTPYCHERLKTLAKQQINSVDVICPGFSADCLETLEEIKIENQAIFGGNLNYIPALNENVDYLVPIILKHLQGWL